jgi:choline kinase
MNVDAHNVSNRVNAKKSCKIIGVLLSAGIGSRLRPLTDKLPKSLIEVGDVPIILRQLDAMKASGIDKVVVVCGYRSEMLKDAILTSKYNQFVEIIENKEYQTTNNLYSAYLAFEFIEHSDALKDYDRVVLANGDVVFDGSILADMIAQPENQIAVDIGIYFKESMKVSLGNEGQITKISKEITENEA